MHEDIAALSFEQALLELEEIVKNQSLGKTKLDEAVQVYVGNLIVPRRPDAV